MKKIIALLSCCLIPLITACNCNGPYRKRMLEYYSVDSNYETLTGIIVEITNDCILEIEILTENHEFPMYNNSCMDFQLYTSLVSDYDINIGDKITFTSAPRIFYDGHLLPIVSLAKDEEQLLTFEIGKNEYLKWIQEEF